MVPLFCRLWFDFVVYGLRNIILFFKYFPENLIHSIIYLFRDVTRGKIKCDLCDGGYRVKVSENLGATVVIPVTPVDTSLLFNPEAKSTHIRLKSV